MYCQRCGVELSDDSVFCGKCGFKQASLDYSREFIDTEGDSLDETCDETQKRSLHDVFEEEHFEDASEASEYLGVAEKKLRLSGIAVGIAVFATILISFSHTDIFNPTRNPDLFYVLGMGCTVTAYILGGGLMRALRIVGTVLMLILYFPAPILLLLIAKCLLLIFCLAIAFFGIAFFPVVFVLINYISLRINYRRAKEYLC